MWREILVMGGMFLVLSTGCRGSSTPYLRNTILSQNLSLLSGYQLYPMPLHGQYSNKQSIADNKNKKDQKDIESARSKRNTWIVITVISAIAVVATLPAGNPDSNESSSTIIYLGRGIGTLGALVGLGCIIYYSF